MKTRRLSSIIRLGLIVCITLIGGHSCRKSVEPVLSQDVEPKNISSLSIDLSADLTDHFGLQAQDEESFKALSIYQRDEDGNGAVSGDERFAFKIDIEKYSHKRMHLFLRKKGDPDITSVFAPVEIILNKESGRYSMRMVVENVYPNKSSLDFTQGEWYISGFWGGSESTDYQSGDERQRHTVKAVAPVSPNKLGDAVEMDIPLGFPWTPITAKKIGPTVVVKHMGLKIRPMGVLLSLSLNNRTRYTADITALDKEMQGFAFGGYFDLSATQDSDLGSTDEVFPRFRPAIIENVAGEKVNILPQEIALESGATTTKPIYMWLMPTEQNVSGGHHLSFTFVSRNRTTMDESLYPSDRFAKNGIGTFTDRYTIDLSFKSTPKNSLFFIREVKIKSGLMISEYFINRHRINLSDVKLQHVREPNFLGYVELYNPNLDPIELKHYALARISNIRRSISVVNRDGKQVSVAGKNNCFFHPMALDKYTIWANNDFFPAKPKGTADRDADEATESHKALLISLQLKNGAKSSFQPNSLGFRSHLETKSGIRKELYYDTKNDDRTENVRFLKGEVPNGQDAKLEGGKAMVLLGNGFISSGNPSDIPYYYYSDTYGNSGYYRPDYQLSAQDWGKIVNNPNCQIVVAIDNYIDRGAFPFNKDAGVMNLNWSDALFLVQKHSKDPLRRRIIDATSANPFARVNNWTDFVRQVTLANETELGRAHFRVRTVAQRMPEFLNFQTNQWLAVPFTGIVPSEVSLGQRSTNPNGY